MKLDARELAGKFAQMLVTRPARGDKPDRFPLFNHLVNLALAQGEKVESIGFCGIKLEKNIQRSLNAALTEFATKYPDLKN